MLCVIIIDYCCYGDSTEYVQCFYFIENAGSKDHAVQGHSEEEVGRL